MKPYELLARFKSDGTIAGCHVRTISTVDGRDYESEPVPLASATDPAFVAFAASFSASVVTERDALAIDKTKLTTDLASKTSEHDSVKGQYDALVIEKAKIIADNQTATDKLNEDHAKSITDINAVHALAIATATTQLEAKQAELTLANAANATLQSRFDKLLNDLPFNPRIIDATSFYARITKDEFALLSVSDDATVRDIAKTILAYKANDWPIIFESPEMQGMLTYLLLNGSLSEGRIAQLTQDANQSEAYVALP